MDNLSGNIDRGRTSHYREQEFNPSTIILTYGARGASRGVFSFPFVREVLPRGKPPALQAKRHIFTEGGFIPRRIAALEKSACFA